MCTANFAVVKNSYLQSIVLVHYIFTASSLPRMRHVSEEPDERKLFDVGETPVFCFGEWNKPMDKSNLLPEMSPLKDINHAKQFYFACYAP